VLNKLLVAGVVGALLTAAPQARAQGNLNEVSTFTTTEAIEIAGVILQPGTYVIRVADQASGETYNRNVIQVTSEDSKKVYLMAAAVPRAVKPETESDVPLLEYYNAANGQPKALRTWFPARTKTARDIVYPRKRAMELASITHETVPSVPDETKETELTTVELTPIAPPMPPEPKPAEPQPAAMVAEAAPQMPETASREPLFAGLGLLSLGGALALRQLARRGM
jgi:hypothetical protein